MAGLRKKVVQTKVDTEEYHAIVTIAKSKRMTIKEALRESLRW